MAVRILALAGTAALIGLAAPPAALAQGTRGSETLRQESLDTQRSGPGVSQGTPAISGTRGDGRPDVTYQGAPAGNLAPGGTPAITGTRGDGRPQIEYQQPPAGGPRTAAPGMPARAAAPATAGRRPGTPTDVSNLLAGAQVSLRGRRFTTVQNDLERAETRLLNARSDGGPEIDGALTQVTAARQALLRRDYRATDEAINSAMRTLGAPG